MADITCPTCTRVQPDEINGQPVIYCANCGADLNAAPAPAPLVQVQTRTCNFCGATVPRKVTRCQYCGNNPATRITRQLAPSSNPAGQPTQAIAPTATGQNPAWTGALFGPAPAPRHGQPTMPIAQPTLPPIAPPASARRRPVARQHRPTYRVVIFLFLGLACSLLAVFFTVATLNSQLTGQPWWSNSQPIAQGPTLTTPITWSGTLKNCGTAKWRADNTCQMQLTISAKNSDGSYSGVLSEDWHDGLGFAHQSKVGMDANNYPEVQFQTQGSESLGSFHYNGTFSDGFHTLQGSVQGNDATFTLTAS